LGLATAEIVFPPDGRAELDAAHAAHAAGAHTVAVLRTELSASPR
jgi:hypothetical protein